MVQYSRWLVLGIQFAGYATYAVVTGLLLDRLGIVGTVFILLAFMLVGIVWFTLAMPFIHKWRRGEVRGVIKVPVGLFCLVGYVFDVVILNWVVGQVLFFGDKTQEFTLTARLQRIRMTQDGWRRRIADFVCGLLNRVDPGHC